MVKKKSPPILLYKVIYCINCKKNVEKHLPRSFCHSSFPLK